MDRGQLILSTGAALLVLYETLSGWRLGIARQVVRCLALAAAYVVGVVGGSRVAPLLRPLGLPDFALGAVGGLLLGIAAYLAIEFVGRVLFKKTSEQEFGLVWFFYGITGALLGAGFGLALALAGAVAIRFLGTLAQGTAAQPAPVAATQPGRHPSRAAGEEGEAKPAPPKPTAVAAGLIEMKQALETGVAGEVIRTLDPIPKQVYVMVGKIGQTVSHPESISRFLAFPGAAELTQRPEILALRDDPAIGKALQDRHYLALLKNERIIKAANNPKIAALLKKFDLEKALDYANQREPEP